MGRARGEGELGGGEVIEALEKLREWSCRYDNRWLQPDGTVLEVMGDPGVRMGENYGDYIRSMLDAVESEVAERFCEIPVDVNGELCKCGDVIHLTDEDERLMVCGYTVAEDGFVSLYCSNLKDGRRRWLPTVVTHASNVEHVKLRTVEDVLRGMVRLAEDTSNGRLDDGDIEGYADEIRELMGCAGMTEDVYCTDGAFVLNESTGGSIVRCRDCAFAYRVHWSESCDVPPEFLNCHGPLVDHWDYERDEPAQNPVEPEGYCAWGARRSE